MLQGDHVTLFPARFVAILALLLALTAGYVGFTTLVQDLAYTRAQTELSFWGRGDYHPSPEVVVDTEETLRGLLEKSPRHPDFLILQARYAVWRAYWSDNLHTREDFSRAAIDNQFLALESRPAHRHSWATMVEYASRARDGESMRQRAQTGLELLQPSDNPQGLVRKETR